MSNLQQQPHQLSWVEIKASALRNNLKIIKKNVGEETLIAPCVKGNAYGHGLKEVSAVLSGAGADWLCVNALFEAEILRNADLEIPIYILGYVPISDLQKAVAMNCRLVVYNAETIIELAKISKKTGKKVYVHLKIETGNNRQGLSYIEGKKLLELARNFPGIEVEGISTHFANIEDIARGKHAKLAAYPKLQLENFQKAIGALENSCGKFKFKHCSNSAATILYPETHFNMVRPGIIIYGLWPSENVKSIAGEHHKNFKFEPALSWKTRVAQIKQISKGSYIGYGCTYKTGRKTKLAILPIGYYDGFDRKFSNRGHVLINGKKAPIRGRVCMNITMVDISGIPNVELENEVTLLGGNKNEEITAEHLAALADTINYEITTRINERIPRIIV